MENKVTTTGINPRVSYTNEGKYARNGSAMTIVTLKSILNRCASNEFKGREKGRSGCILPYVSTKFGERPFVHEGVVILDLDKFNKEPGLKGKEDLIYEKFDEIAAIMPNILAMNYSYSHNLHIFVYDRNVVDAQSYNKMQPIYTALFAKVVRSILNIDFREYKDALDDHQKAYQKLFVNYSPYKWNYYCTQLSLSPKQLKTLQSEYKIVFEKIEDCREVCESTNIVGNGDIVVDKNYAILGWKGFRARTAIAAATYFHFDKDLQQSKKWLSATFKNAKDIYSQMLSMVRNGNINHWYTKEAEFVLFPSGKDKYTLKEGEYLSDIIDFDTLNESYYYIQSNTNTGKTEFVKNLIRDQYVEIIGSEDLFGNKRYSKVDGRKVIILQMTKALRDGKKRGIEDKTYGNWDKIVDKEQIHTTLEGFDRNIVGLNLSEYTIVVDESHLLEEYITIRRDLTKRVLNYLEKAGKVIFMSATPKSDFKMFPFKKLVFEKTQKQRLDVYQYPLYRKGNGSRIAARYTHIIKFIRDLEKRGEKVLVFSNKYQSEWKTYGLDENVTFFNATNIKDVAMLEILNNNRLINNITLATKYMGCGVEIKGEKKVHIVFLLDEGWNFDFIVQTLGRPRDAENIVLHLFYSDYKKWKVGLSKSQLAALRNAFDNLYYDAVDGYPILNILAARMTGIYKRGNANSVDEKIKTLIIGSIVSESNIHTPYSLELFKYLPYEEVNIHRCDGEDFNTNGVRQYIRKETELIEYICSLSEAECERLFSMEYDDIFMRVPHRDKSEGRKVIRICKYIVRHRLNLKEVMSFFDKVSLTESMVKTFVTYCRINAGWSVVNEFEGSEQTKKEFDDEVAKMKSIFTKEFIEGYITDIMRPGYLGDNTLKLTLDDVFIDVLKSLGVWREEYSHITYQWSESYNDASMFKGSTYKECMPRGIINSLNGKKGGRTKQSISIEVIASGEVKTFSSKSECSDYLRSKGYSARQFNKLLKGEGDLSALYKVL